MYAYIVTKKSWKSFRALACRKISLHLVTVSTIELKQIIIKNSGADTEISRFPDFFKYFPDFSQRFPDFSLEVNFSRFTRANVAVSAPEDKFSFFQLFSNLLPVKQNKKTEKNSLMKILVVKIGSTSIFYGTAMALTIMQR